MAINQFHYQIGSTQSSFRGMNDDWNALGTNAQVKSSVDSIAVSVNGQGAGRNAAHMHQTFRKGRFRQLGNQANTQVNNVSLTSLY